MAEPSGPWSATSLLWGPPPGTSRDLATLVPLLLRPAPDRDRLAGEVVDPDLQTSEDEKRFTDKQWEMAEDLLEVLVEARTLSSLLEEAATPQFWAARPGGAAGSARLQPAEPASPLRRRDNRILLAVHAGTKLDSQGFRGDDLLLTSAQLTDPPETGQPTDTEQMVRNDNR